MGSDRIPISYFTEVWAEDHVFKIFRKRKCKPSILYTVKAACIY